MEFKLFEVRDRMTCISAMGIKMVDTTNARNSWLLERAEYAQDESDGPACIFFIRISPYKEMGTFDPYEWPSIHPGSYRTMQVAHDYVEKNWNTLKTGEVIDVEFILGETQEKKTSDQFHESHETNYMPVDKLPDKIYFCFGRDSLKKEFFDDIKDALAFKVINGGSIAVFEVEKWLI